VYGRSLDDDGRDDTPERVLTLGASGWTYRNTFVLFDRETDSLWYPFDDEGLRGISGPLADRLLPAWPSFDGTWARFRDDHEAARLMR